MASASSVILEGSVSSAARTEDAALRAYADQFATLVAAARAIAFANARTALVSIFRAAGLAPGDEVILSPLTCKVVPLSVLSLQLKPVYADIADTLNLDARHLSAVAGPRTRAVLFQHTYGSPAGLDAVATWADARGLLLVEDRAQCLPIASEASMLLRGRAAIFSNNLLKPLPAGSGGVAVTDDEGLARRIEEISHAYPVTRPSAERKLRVSAWVHDHVLGPRSYWPLLNLYERFDSSYHPRAIAVELQSEIIDEACRPGPYQLRRGLESFYDLEQVVRHRRLCTADYASAITDMRHVEVATVDTSLPLYYFPVLVRDKPTLLQSARRQRIELIAWPRRTPIYPIDDASRLSAYGYEPGRCPVAESVAARLVGLPTHSRITARHRTRLMTLLRAHAT
jgi:dTDP-4-amino-4,6-dideoxygalactose transaminase